jgi:hypothetical protein
LLIEATKIDCKEEQSAFFETPATQNRLTVKSIIFDKNYMIDRKQWMIQKRLCEAYSGIFLPCFDPDGKNATFWKVPEE